MPPGTPAFVQSMARAGSRIPDHACAWRAAGITRSKTKGKRSNCLRFIMFYCASLLGILVLESTMRSDYSPLSPTPKRLALGFPAGLLAQRTDIEQEGTCT